MKRGICSNWLRNHPASEFSVFLWCSNNQFQHVKFNSMFGIRNDDAGRDADLLHCIYLLLFLLCACVYLCSKNAVWGVHCKVHLNVAILYQVIAQNWFTCFLCRSKNLLSNLSYIVRESVSKCRGHLFTGLLEVPNDEYVMAGLLLIEAKNVHENAN